MDTKKKKPGSKTGNGNRQVSDTCTKYWNPEKKTSVWTKWKKISKCPTLVKGNWNPEKKDKCLNEMEKKDKCF